jgi:phytol kinase
MKWGRVERVLPFLLPILGGAGVLAAVCGGVEALARKGPLAGERGRKAVHVLGGSVTAVLPLWLSATQVTFLALSVFASFVASRRLRLLRCVHGGPDRGAGELVYCAAVAVVAATVGVGAAFVAAILTLSYADAGAALVGERFGRHRLPKPLASKTWSGSLSCLVIAAAANAAVLSGAHTGTLLSATGLSGVLLLGVGAAAAEAVPRRGWDNLSVPVTVAAGWVLLFGT